MTASDGKYNIKAISLKLGIQPGTLRAWERRYRVIQPSRNSAGHRLYSEKQLQLIHWLVNKVQQGFTIGQAVELLETEWASISPTKDSYQQLNQTAYLASQVLEALLSFNDRQATQLVNKAFSLYSVDHVAYDVLGSVYRQAHMLYQETSISYAHLYTVKSYIEVRLMHILSNLSVNTHLPKVLTVQFSESIQWLLFTLFMKQKGFEVIYLGAGVSKTDVELVLRETHPQLCVCFFSNDKESTRSLISLMNSTFPDTTFAWDGETFLHNEESFYHIGLEPHEWEQWYRGWYQKTKRG